MPVINLPRDTRWGDLGAGIGNVLAGALNAYNDQQLSQQVGQVIEDPSVPQTKKGSRILEKFGRKGLDLYDKLMQQQQTSAVVQHLMAQVGTETLRQKMLEQQVPYAGPEAAAKVKATEAEVPLRQAQAAATQAEVPLRQAQTVAEQALTQPRAALTTEQASEAGQRARLLKTQADIASGAVPSAQFNPDVMLAPFKGQLNDQQYQQWRTSLEQTYAGAERQKPGSGYNAAAGQLRSLTATVSKAETPKPLDASDRQRTAQSAEYATTMKQFADTLTQRPSEVGLLTGAPLKAWLERHGIASGDPTLVTLLETQSQAVGQQARGGSVFMSGQTIKLAKDIAPNISRTPLANTIALNTIADQQVSRLQNDKVSLEGTNVQTKGIDDAIARWQAVKDVTGSLKTQVFRDTKTGNERTAVYFGGNQVSPTTFAPWIKNDTSKYTVTLDGKPVQVTGQWLFDQASQNQVDPATVLMRLGGRVGG